MQPNQQLPPQQSPSSGGGGNMPYQVPDYLNLAPAPTPPPKSNKLRRIIIMLPIVLVIILGGVIVWLQFSSQLTPDQRLASTLSKSMQTPYVSRKVSIKSDDNKISLTETADSDVSDPAHPKGRITYSYSYKGTANDPRTMEVGGDIIDQGDSVTARLTHESQAFVAAADLNKWTTMNTSNVSQLGKFDPINIRGMINTSFFLIPMGNFQDTARTSILNYIQSHATYTVKGLSHQSSNGQNSTEFSLIESPTKQAALAVTIADTLKSDTADTVSSPLIGTDFSLWTDGNDKVQKITMQGSSTSHITGEIDYTYPASVTINNP